MNKLARVLIFLGALLLLWAVMALLGMRSKDRRALQTYQAELKAKGEKLTFADLTRGRTTNAFDSHAVLTNAAVRLSGARLNPGLLEWQKYAGPGLATALWRQSALARQKSAGPGSGDTWEEFAAQMQTARGTLQEIREALKEPAADAGPSTNMLSYTRVNFVAVRTVAQWLAGAAENELHQGHLEDGLQNLEALAELARMERDEYTLVAQMIRIAVADLGLSVTWDALQAPGWTEPQLERLQHAWQPVDLVDAVEKGIVGGRAFVPEMFAWVRRSSGRQTYKLGSIGANAGSLSPKVTFDDVVMDYLLLPAYKLTSIDADELFYLQIVQENIAVIRLLKAHRPWPEARQAGLTAAARLNLTTAPDRLRHYISLMHMPNFTRAYERSVHVETERQMTLAAIGLKRYQLRHGQRPATLETLVPEFLPAVPYDCMSGQPLRYRLKVDGGYVLYSVGENGKDDGGDPTPPPGTSPGLWEGRDAVWPSPATEPGEVLRQPER